MADATATHRTTWFVFTGETDADGRAVKIPRTAGMRGWWPGFDAECTCGWATRTGGATRGHIRERVADHAWDVERGFA